MLLLHDSTRTGSPPAICQRRRRRGGAELSGKVRCHGEGCVVRERKRSKNLAQAPIPHVRPCRKCRLVVRLSGCLAAQARSSETQAETRPSPPERAERLQARVSNNSMAWYSQPPGRNESLQREAANTSRRLLAE